MTKADGKLLLIVFLGCSIALITHQKFVAPMLSPKPKA
jgi:hypothetical protein